MIGIKKILTSLLKKINIYNEVGAIYITTSATNPATVFGGTWSKITDYFLVSSGSYNDITYTVNATGGTANSIIPYHRHNLGNCWSDGSGSYSCYKKTANRVTFTRYTNVVGTSGNATGANIPQYYAVYIWQRTSKTATLTYDANGGSLGSVPASVSMTSAADTLVTTYSPTPPTISGYSVVFLGWAMADTANEPQFVGGQTFKYAGVDPVNSTLYAVYQKTLLNFTITVLSNDNSKGTVSGTGSDYTINTICNLNAAPTTGNKFLGWNTDIAGLGAYYDRNTPYQFYPTQNETIYGLFVSDTENTFQIQRYSEDDIITCTFNPGMNWQMWCDSEYNIYPIETDENYVYYEGMPILNTDESMAARNENLVSGTTYVLETIV